MLCISSYMVSAIVIAWAHMSGLLLLPRHVVHAMSTLIGKWVQWSEEARANYFFARLLRPLSTFSRALQPNAARLHKCFRKNNHGRLKPLVDCDCEAFHALPFSSICLFLRTNISLTSLTPDSHSWLPSSTWIT